MESHPFKHDTVPDSSGLVVISSLISKCILSYKCTLCNKEYPIVNDSRESSRRNFLKHAKSKSHLTHLNASPSINHSSHIATDDTSNNSPTNFHHTNNEYTIDDDIQYNTSNINEISDHASFEMKDDLNIQRTLIDLFGEYSVNYLFFHKESLILNSGCKAIIAKCLTETSLHSFISDFDVDLHFNILKVLTALSQRQRRSLANVFASFVFQVYDRGNNLSSTESNSPTSITIDIPVTYQDFRRDYIHGPNSLLCNLPHPKVYCSTSQNQCGYSFTKVKDCIAHFLASGGQLFSPDQICRAAVTKALNLCLSNSQVPIFIKIWSDGFEINNIKQNRGHGAWACTFTIFGKSNMNRNLHEDIASTFALGLCKSNDYDNQDLILRGIIEEINYLHDNDVSYYYHHEKKIIKGRVIILLTTQDQLERRKRNYLLLGNSKPSNRWGYIIPDIDEINNKLPSCSSCIDNMINDTWNYKSSFCNECYNWDSSLSPKKQKLSHKYLLDTLDDIHTQLSHNVMSLAILKDITISRGLNEKAACLIYDRYHKTKIKLTIQQASQSSNNILHPNIVTTCMAGEEYQLWSGSPLWQSLSHDIDDNIDAPMHLLFLGIVKSTMGYISEFFKVTTLDRSFTKFTSHKMKCLYSIYKLNWLKLLPFKNCGSILDTTGWVGENFLSFSRIFFWYISSLSLNENLHHQSNISDIVDEDVHSWSKIKLRRYVENNNITVIKANENGKHPTMLDYRCAIIDYKTTRDLMRNDDESIIDPFCCNVNDVIQLVNYLHHLIHTLMRKSNVHVTITRNSIEKYSRLFIYQLYKVTSYLSIKDIHLRLWNCQSLLNLGEMYERFGHVDMYWEGGVSGEAIIKYFKREKSCLTLDKWPYHMLLSYYRRRALEIHVPVTDVEQINQKKMYHVYKSFQQLTSMMTKSLPISFLRNISSQKNYAFVFNEDNKRTIVDIILEEKSIDIYGTWYEIKSTICADKLIEDDIPDGFIAAMLLPSIHLDVNMYTVVDYNWN